MYQRDEQIREEYLNNEESIKKQVVWQLNTYPDYIPESNLLQRLFDDALWAWENWGKVGVDMTEYIDDINFDPEEDRMPEYPTEKFLEEYFSAIPFEEELDTNELESLIQLWRES